MLMAMIMAANTHAAAIQNPPNTIQRRLSKRDIRAPPLLIWRSPPCFATSSGAPAANCSASVDSLPATPYNPAGFTRAGALMAEESVERRLAAILAADVVG